MLVCPAELLEDFILNESSDVIPTLFPLRVPWQAHDPSRQIEDPGFQFSLPF